MNYFEIFNLDISFDIDLNLLQSKYLDLQRMVHPDTLNLANMDKDLSLVNASSVNLAYNVLKDDIKRGQHILKLNGINSIDELNVQLDIDFYDNILSDSEVIDTIVLNSVVHRKLSCKETSQLEQIIKKRTDEYSNHYQSASNYYKQKQIDIFGIHIVILRYISNLITKAQNILNSY